MCSQKNLIEISKLILIYNCSRLSRMQRGEWSLLLLRCAWLLSASEQMKGHSDMIKLVCIVYLFLSQFHVYKFRSKLSDKKGWFFFFFFFLNLLEFVCEERGLTVNWTCQLIDMFEILLQKVGFSYLEIETFWKITCSNFPLTTSPIFVDKRLKLSTEQAYNYATINVILGVVSLAVRVLSQSKIFDVVFLLTKGKPLVQRKKSCLI